MDEAIEQGNAAFDTIKHLPSSLEGAVDASNAVFNNVDPIMATWVSLREKIKQLTEIVDKIAEARNTTIWWLTVGLMSHVRSLDPPICEDCLVHNFSDS